MEEDRPILMPGEPEALIEAARRRDGIPLTPEDLTSLRAEAESLGLPPPAFLSDL
jgi:LDH2 family malate/lactate/ureidoglycolate dehydrogenase